MLTSPLLILHAEDDNIIPHRMGRKVGLPLQCLLGACCCPLTEERCTVLISSCTRFHSRQRRSTAQIFQWKWSLTVPNWDCPTTISTWTQIWPAWSGMFCQRSHFKHLCFHLAPVAMCCTNNYSREQLISPPFAAVLLFCWTWVEGIVA